MTARRIIPALIHALLGALLGALLALPVTAATPYLVKEISSSVARPEHLVPLHGGVLFDALGDPPTEINSPYHPDLWFSDGTEAGTRKVLEDQTMPWDMVACAGRVFFSRDTVQNASALWSTDGTAAGTGLVKELAPGAAPHGFTCVDGIAFFYANIAAPNTSGLWRSDGTAAGTILVKETGPAIGVGAASPLVPFQHWVFYSTYNPGTGRLWRSDGTPAGTVVVKEFPDVSRIMDMRVAGDRLYLVIRQSALYEMYSLWVWDGATATSITTLPRGGGISLNADFYGRLNYGSWFSNAPDQLCTTDGTNAGTCFTTAPPAYSAPFTMLPLNGRLYYTHLELRTSDGLTEVVAAGVEMESFFTTGGGLLYGKGNLQNSGSRLLESDGTLAGTRVLLNQPLDFTIRGHAASSGGRVFLAAEELYALDSTITPTGFSPAGVAAPGGQTVTITGRGFTGPVAIKVGGVDALVGAVTPTSITFTAPVHDPGSYPIDLTLGSGLRMNLDDPLAYTCTPTSAAATVNPAAVCPFTPVTLQGSGGTRCSWFPVTGLDDPSSCTPKAAVAATTTYTLVVYTANGCASTNYPSVTVNVIPPPSATITVPAATGVFLAQNSTFTASVADAGAGATYAWSGTGLTLTGGQTTRTVTFRTSCEARPKLNVTVTAATGCISTATRLLPVEPAWLTSFSPEVANPGTPITITGTGLDCVAPLQLRGLDESTQTMVVKPLAVTKISPATVQFRMPADAPRSSKIEDVVYTYTYDIAAKNLLRSVPRDMNLDVASDIFWRNNTTGETSVWTVTGSTFTGLASSPAPSGWVPAAFGDFSGDSRADVIWYNPSTGETSIWLMNGVRPSVQVRSTRVPAGWKPAGTGDFNGDGKSDIFWHNAATGETSIWFMDGTAIASAIRSLTVPVGWRPAAFGDFNADGKGDVAWLRTATGETSLWLMNGTGTPATAVRSVTLAPPWALAGSGDFNGDRKDDLFWHNPTTGATQIWQLNGVAIVNQTAGVTMPAGYVPAVLAHFDTNSFADVFWFKAATGETSMWLRSATTAASPVPFLRVKDLNWKPVIVP
jgi:ELWxxDGT repeat protein